MSRFAQLCAAALPLAALAVPLSTSAKADMLLAPIWTGAYIGLHAGADWTDVDINGASAFTSDAAVGGVHAGFNFQLFGLVAGLEADASLDNTSASTTIFPATSAELSADWNASLRGRLGAAFGPILVYGTAGIAWTETSIATVTPGFADTVTDVTKTGFVYGAGVEAYVLPNMTVRVEALQYDYESQAFDPGGGNPLMEFDPSSTVVRAGVTLHF